MKLPTHKCVYLSLKQNPAGTFSIASLLLVLLLPHHDATCHYSLLPCQFIMMTSYLLYHHYFLAPSHCSTNNLNSLIFQETILHWTMVVGTTVSGLSKLHCYSIHSFIPKTINFQPCLKCDPLTHDDHIQSFVQSISYMTAWLYTWKTEWFPSRDISQKFPKTTTLKNNITTNRVYIAKRVTTLGTWGPLLANPFHPPVPFPMTAQVTLFLSVCAGAGAGVLMKHHRPHHHHWPGNFGNVCRWNQRSKRRRREHQHQCHLCGIPTCPPLGLHHFL